MKFHIWITGLLLTGACTSIYGQAHTYKGWVNLFNEKDLSGWVSYLDIPLDSNGKKMANTPLGFQNDPQQVFTIVKDKGQSVIRVSGQTWGAIISDSMYENYHLQVMFKWGTHTWASKRGKPMDSGLLYHSVGAPGTESGSWMRSQEFQIEEGNCGDYWSIGKIAQTIPSEQGQDSIYQYRKGAMRHPFGYRSSTWCRHVAGNSENPRGQWNRLDLYCYKDTSIHVVNGKVVMVLYNSREISNNEFVPLVKGKIQLQSEGGEIFFKNIRVKHIDKLPDTLAKNIQ
jgi:hypothetical protein